MAQCARPSAVIGAIGGAPNQSLQLTGRPLRDRLQQQDVQCLCRRTGVAGPQLSSTVRPQLYSRVWFYLFGCATGAASACFTTSRYLTPPIAAANANRPTHAYRAAEQSALSVCCLLAGAVSAPCRA